VGPPPKTRTERLLPTHCVGCLFESASATATTAVTGSSLHRRSNEATTFAISAAPAAAAARVTTGSVNFSPAASTGMLSFTGGRRIGDETLSRQGSASGG
jgi:hypothetical protein